MDQEAWKKAGDEREVLVVVPFFPQAAGPLQQALSSRMRQCQVLLRLLYVHAHTGRVCLERQFLCLKKVKMSGLANGMRSKRNGEIRTKGMKRAEKEYTNKSTHLLNIFKRPRTAYSSPRISSPISTLESSLARATEPPDMASVGRPSFIIP
jgi:hypothetical protein